MDLFPTTGVPPTKIFKIPYFKFSHTIGPFLSSVEQDFS
jgi:hypothetical protein